MLAGVAGVSSLAGCVDILQRNGEETPPPDNETNASDDADVDNETEPPAANETDEPEPEPALGELEAIQPAKTDLEAALNQYVASADADDATVLSISSASETFDFVPVVNTARAAIDALDAAERFEDDERVLAAIAILRQERVIIDQMARTQHQGQEAAAEARAYLEAIEENFQLLRGRNRLRGENEVFTTEIDAFASELEAAAETIVRDRQRYADKREQFRREQEAFRIYTETYETVSEGLDLLRDASADLEDEDYNDAEPTAAEAIERFDETLERLAQTPEDVLVDLTDAFIATIELRRESAASIRTLAADRR